MDYISPLYLFAFLPALLLVYALAPKRFRWVLLLLASYAFFFLISRFLLVYLLAVTGTTYAAARLMASIDARSRAARKAQPDQAAAVKARAKRQKQTVLFFGVAIPMGILLFLKYSGFFASNLNLLLTGLHLSAQLPVPALALPLGISFYTLQAVSYLVDVNRAKLEADRHLGRFALYMSFFPIIMEGPICRYDQIAPALYAGEPLKGKNVSFGIQRIVWGLFKKLIIADRLNPMVNTVFNNHTQYSGLTVLLAAVCYALQLYADFSGCIDITIGTGELFGVTIPENFRQPFFARTASEFWRRWHITLGTWLKDYIFFPVSLSKLGKKISKESRHHLGRHAAQVVQTILPLGAVWLCSGLWHGAGWNYIFYGLYYFTLILLENATEPLWAALDAKLHLKRDGAAVHAVQSVKMLLVIFTGELFFRANGLRAGFSMFKSIFTGFSWSVLSDGTFLSLGPVPGDYAVAAGALLVVLIVGLIHERGISIRQCVAGWKLPLRWAFYCAVLLLVILFGAYGTGYLPADMIYAGF